MTVGGTTSRRLFRRTAIVTSALFVAALIAQIGVVFFPKHDAPAQADVAVVLAPYFGRIDPAVRMIEEGLVDALAISAPWHRGPPAECEVNGLPELADQVTVVCFAPEPVTTQGEALSFAAATDAFGWNSAAVVTDRTHLNRARLYFESCAPQLDYEFVLAPMELTPAQQIGWLTYETGAWMKAASVGICGAP